MHFQPSPYLPNLPPNHPATVHHPIAPTSLPHVNDAFGRVERNLSVLNNTLSHPHTLNNASSYHRAVNISNQVENLTSMVGSLKKKIQSFENSKSFHSENVRYKISPTACKPGNNKHNMTTYNPPTSIISPPTPRIKVTNPYLKKKKGIQKTNNSVQKTNPSPSSQQSFSLDNFDFDPIDFYDPVPSNEHNGSVCRRMNEK